MVHLLIDRLGLKLKGFLVSIIQQRELSYNYLSKNNNEEQIKRNLNQAQLSSWSQKADKAQYLS